MLIDVLRKGGAGPTCLAAKRTVMTARATLAVSLAAVALCCAVWAAEAGCEMVCDEYAAAPGWYTKRETGGACNWAKLLTPWAGPFLLDNEVEHCECKSRGKGQREISDCYQGYGDSGNLELGHDRECGACPAGQRQGKPAHSETPCKSCRAGAYSNSQQTACEPCGQGARSREESAGKCSRCPARACAARRARQCDT